MAKFDPLLMEVIKNGLISITEEMSATLYRSAYSTNIKTRKDYSCALFDEKLREVAQSFAQPAHLGIIFRMIPMVVKQYGEDNLVPGDMLITNNPYSGGAHLNDICIIAPIFSGENKIGYVANMAHHVDVGGSTPSSLPLSRELYQEGIIIPPVKIVSSGEVSKDIFNFFKQNIRAKYEVTGDIMAQIAANRTGEIRLLEFLKRYDYDMMRDYSNEILNYTEKRTLNEIKGFPSCDISSEDHLDDDGFEDIPIKIKVKVSIKKDSILFDFTGSDKQRRSPMNATLAFTYSAVGYVLKCLISDDIPVNDGFYRCVRIKAPEGSVVNATEPTGVVGGYEVGQKMISAMFKAFAKILPDRIIAGNKGNICNIGFGGYDPRKKDFYAYMETVGGGSGARKGKDGINACNLDLSNTENAPVEEMEIGYPVMITKYEMIPDSGGAGRWRGGLGIRRDYKFPWGQSSFSIISDRSKIPPWGIFGGKEALGSRYILNPGTGNEKVLSSKDTFDINEGDVVSVQNSGGGGYGDPLERNIEDIKKDIRQGKITICNAVEDYGLVMGKDNTIDMEATIKSRKETGGKG
jgi:N-methylhydantoinase B